MYSETYPYIHKKQHALSMMPSIFPSSTVFLMDWAVSTTESENFFVALDAKLKIKSEEEEQNKVLALASVNKSTAFIYCVR